MFAIVMSCGFTSAEKRGNFLESGTSGTARRLFETPLWNWNLLTNSGKPSSCSAASGLEFLHAVSECHRQRVMV